jgi:hypothetical protein
MLLLVDILPFQSWNRAQLTDASYLFGFFFWMDLMGTLSMIFDSATCCCFASTIS